jgi:hypothetical protein
MGSIAPVLTGSTLVHLGSDCSDAGLDLLKDKSLLLIINAWRAELFRSPAEAGTIEGFQDLGRSFDAFISISVSGFQICDLALKSIGARCLSAMARTMAFRVSTSSGSCRSGGVMRPTRAYFAPVFLPF